ncbi:RNA polymerase sigma factor [Thalassoglobus neptunius]|uniref:RNA polymerase sigma factor n=1 Tax=Thalassoglobus neptunius TaxID=1938619 RepID=A0A5C5X0F7_9PLAN|nr:RNA polymerase sigma factor [Thalassoglobus neptunius]TWT55771.1 RNA polymerase sigma factor [Thalassoglobus neptunius]
MHSNESKQLNSASLTSWYTEFSPRIRVFLVGLLRDSALAEEALQVTFEKALTEGGNVRSGAEKAWLFQVAFNEAMQFRRRLKTQKRAYTAISQTVSSQEVGQPFDQILTDERVQSVKAAIESLPEKYQNIVKRRIYQEQTFQTIADECELPLGTVLSQMQTALTLLHERLKDYESIDASKIETKQD